MKILVTGATGFIGRYIVNRLLENGHTVRAWYRAGSDRGGFRDDGKSVAWIEGDLADADSVKPLVADCDAVVHGALARGGAASEYVATNVLGSIRLIESARAAGARRFVFISTCAVHERILDDRPLDEAHPLWPHGHYGAHKAAIEKFVHSFGLGEGFPICALRPTGVYGLRRPARNSRWLGLVRDVMAGRDIASPAGGKEVHVEDVARAVDLLLNADAPAVTGEAFNCYDRYVADQDIARIAVRLTGSGSHVAARNRGPRHQIDTSKLRALSMTFGGDERLEAYVRELIELVTSESP